MTRTSHCRVRVPAEPLELVLLEHTQDLCLRIRAHVAHLVEEEAATIGLLEPADTLAIGRR